MAHHGKPMRHRDVCTCHEPLAFDFSFAFQPIVDVLDRSIFAHEALVRGHDGAGAGSILSRVTDKNRYAFDQACRTKAIDLAQRLGLSGYVSINFLPNAVYDPATCLGRTLSAAKAAGFPTSRIIFEITEGEKIEDHDHLKNIIDEYKRHGFLTAIDDFGAGYAGLNLLAKYQPDLIKLDMDLTRDIDKNPVKQAIVKSIMGVANEIGMLTIAEGIETVDELCALTDLGVQLFQGYLFAKPAFEKGSSPSALDWASFQRCNPPKGSNLPAIQAVHQKA